MTRFSRILAVTVMTSFFFLVIAESLHHHNTAEAEDHCAFCQLVSHAPALPSSPPMMAAPAAVSKIVVAIIIPATPFFVVPSLARSPPAL